MASSPTVQKGVSQLREKFEESPKKITRSFSQSAQKTVVVRDGHGYGTGRTAVKSPGPGWPRAQPSREHGTGRVKLPVFQPLRVREPEKRTVPQPVTATTDPRSVQRAQASSAQQLEEVRKVKIESLYSHKNREPSLNTSIPDSQKAKKCPGSKPDVRQVEIMRSKAKDSDNQSESQQPEQTTLSVAQRARIFSADKPQSSAPIQRKQSPSETGSQAALDAFQWEETGSQGDDEGLTISVSHSPHLMIKQPQHSQEDLSDSNQQFLNNSSVSRFQKIIPKWFLRNMGPSKTGSQLDLQPSAKCSKLPLSKDTKQCDIQAEGFDLSKDCDEVSSSSIRGQKAVKRPMVSPSKDGGTQKISEGVKSSPQSRHDNSRPSQVQRRAFTPLPEVPARKASKDFLCEADSQEQFGSITRRSKAVKPVLIVPVRNLASSFEVPKKIPPSSQAGMKHKRVTHQEGKSIVLPSSEKPKICVRKEEPDTSQTLTSADTVQTSAAPPSSQLKGNPNSTTRMSVGVSKTSSLSNKQPQFGVRVASKPLQDCPPPLEITKRLHLHDPNNDEQQASVSFGKAEVSRPNSQTESSPQDALQPNRSSAAHGLPNMTKPIPAARSRRPVGVILAGGFSSEALSQIPEDNVIKISVKPKQAARGRKLKEHLAATSAKTPPMSSKPAVNQNTATSHIVEVSSHEDSAGMLDSPNQTTEINMVEKVAATTDTALKGSDAESEGRIIPLWDNKLLQDDSTSKTDGLRRASSCDELPTGNKMLAFTNIQGLFQRAQQLKSHESLITTVKPPLPQKPILPKKPSLDREGSDPGKPRLSPKMPPPSPPKTKPKPSPIKQSPTGKLPQKPIMGDAIYDPVYPEQSDKSNSTKIEHERTSLKKLEKLLGPDFVDNKQPGSAPAEMSKPPKAKKPVRKKTETEDGPKDGPYAIINLPDAEKTAAKNTRNATDQKPLRKISNDNGNKVVLRNSGGMSSGDSGIVGLHGDVTHIKRTMSKMERRMSRRVLREKMKSIDSDFMEDSDDEPIGADSDFDSDVSIEEPAEFISDTHKQAFEVLTTERTYVDTLYLINHVFLAQIQAENEKQHWFPPTVLNDIFSNIKTIYELHSAVLLPELEKRLKEWEKKPCLGEVLKSVAPFLKLYSDYVSNFDNAMKQLNYWTSKVPKFAASIAEKQKHQLCGNLALQHHMLTPIQRIPRYELLLKDYLKKLPADSKDRPDAEKALNMISGAAQHSNDMMKSMDQFEKLLKINEKIDGENIIHPTRRLLKEGKITKITAKNKESQDRYMFLFNDILLCCEKKRLLASTNYKVKIKMEVNGMKVLDSSSCRFIIEGKNKTIEIQTSSEEEREEWMKELLSAICEMVRKKETFKMKDAVADSKNGIFASDGFVPGRVEPRWIRDDETTMCMRCGTDFKITKRRHHCRACGAVVCHKCSNYETPLQYDEGRENKVCFKCYYTLQGDKEELEKLTRKSLVTEIDENNSYASYLYIQQKGVWTKSWVVVTDQELFVFKAPKDVRPVLVVSITQCSVHDLMDSNAERDHVFRLSEGRTIHTLSAESRELKRRWLYTLSQGVHEAARRSVTL